MKNHHNKLMLGFVGLVCLFGVIAILCSLHKKQFPSSVDNAMLVGENGQMVSPPPVLTARTVITDVAKSGDYKLMVGANPTVSQKQKFLPPEGSVAVTNNAQLASLVEQAKQQQPTVQK